MLDDESPTSSPIPAIKEAVIHDVLKPPDMSHLPPIYVIPIHMDTEELHALEDRLLDANAPLTYDMAEAQVFLGKIAQKRRAVLELRGRGIVMQEVDDSQGLRIVRNPRVKAASPSIDDLASVNATLVSLDSETESDSNGKVQLGKRKRGDQHAVPRRSPSPVSINTQQTDLDPSIIQVIKVSWFTDSIVAGDLLDLTEYTVYTGRRCSAKAAATVIPFVKPTQPASQSASPVPSMLPTSAQAILDRAAADNPSTSTSTQAFLSTTQLRQRTAGPARPIHLVHQTTSEHDLGHSTDLPGPPSWVLRHSTYSCERATLLKTPNDPFITVLKSIRSARELTADDIGVRAYSTSIASIQAYPYTITDQREILALPGCDHKIASLWVEWKNRDGIVQAVLDADSDERLKIMRVFWEIWGCGAHTAREFYNRGWRDLDDVVEFGWNELSRVQQIGVKYYEEFQVKIPRQEVEFIGAKVHEHAQRVREASGVRTCIVGGYRRGKEESGDVDVIVSHLDEDATLDIVTDIVKSLFDSGWITHELTTTLSNTRRAQSTLPFRDDLAGKHGRGSSFDTLDKSLVVWQDPNFPDRGKPGAKNPNVHRRVDIIIAPWSKVGCGVLGWTAATTFERDLRRYAKRFKGWKFDSSGIRDRATGQEIDLESVGGRCTSIEEAERKVFRGLGLEWREPWERCAG
jgi:DNA polymerase IV